MSKSNHQKTGMTAFALHQAGFRAHDQFLLEDISLNLQRGRVTGILGPNGSGKSTLMRLMAGQIPPSVGEVLFQGCRVTDYAARNLARCLAHLPQIPPAVPGMTLRDLVALGRYPWHGALGRFGAADHQAVDTALERTGLSALSDRRVDLLSGGERQRGWIAMLLAQGAECLLLDEPISALDLSHQIEVLSLLRRLNHEQGLTVIMVLHDVNLAALFCDDLIALRQGRLVEAASADQVAQPGPLSTLYGLGMEALPWRGRRIMMPSALFGQDET